MAFAKLVFVAVDSYCLLLTGSTYPTRRCCASPANSAYQCLCDEGCFYVIPNWKMAN